jgi:septal ring factor EnvC (AmiA/AmiB activator)
VIPWIAFAVWVALVTVSLVFASVRGYQLYKQVKRTGATINPEVERIAATSERIQIHLERAERSQHRLDEALARLAAARAQLDLQIAAVDEAKRAINTIFPVFKSR